jgi:hypothetical protein
VAAFLVNTGRLRSVLLPGLRGWGGGARRRVEKVREECDTFVQTLNDNFTNPSGRPHRHATGKAAAAAESPLGA